MSHSKERAWFLVLLCVNWLLIISYLLGIHVTWLILLPWILRESWWRHQMETFSALLAFCAWNSPVHGEFPAQRPVTRSFDVFFDLRLNKRLSKQSWGRWSETPSSSLWSHRNDYTDIIWMKWYYAGIAMLLHNSKFHCCILLEIKLTTIYRFNWKYVLQQLVIANAFSTNFHFAIELIITYLTRLYYYQVGLHITMFIYWYRKKNNIQNCKQWNRMECISIMLNIGFSAIWKIKQCNMLRYNTKIVLHISCIAGFYWLWEIR